MFVNHAQASEKPKIIINLPASEAIYTTNDIPLNFTIETRTVDYGTKWEVIYCYTDCYLDGQKFATIVGKEGNITFKALKGEHTLKLQVFTTFSWGFYELNIARTRFFVNTEFSPINILIVGDPVFKPGQTALTITTDWPATSVFYSLNGQTNITLPNPEKPSHGRYVYKLDLPDLSEGTYSISAYAFDAAGNIGTTNKTFTVGTMNLPYMQQATNRQNSETIIAIITGSIIAASSFMFFYKKHKQKNTANR
jgi:hypothetical protein